MDNVTVTEEPVHMSKKLKEKIKPLYEIAAVAGPTASGKTALAIELAKLLNGEIVSCDSMQVYRGMNIGTAKPDEAEQCGIVHHMIDIVYPDCNFSCADYTDAARKVIDEIISRGKFPILCGGTGLYLDSVLKNRQFSADSGRDAGDAEIRAELEQLSPEILYDELKKCDPEAAEKIHPNNVKRVIRALEIYRKTGMTKTAWDIQSHNDEPAYDACVIGLDFTDREKLYDRINRRVDIMMENGLLDEVKSLDLNPKSTAGQAIGYKELSAYLSGECTLDEAVEKIKQGSRNYAKRQLTWFKRNHDIRWISVNDTSTFKNIVNNALQLLTNRI